MKGELLTWTEWWAFTVFSYLECLIYAEDDITSLVSKGDSKKKKPWVRVNSNPPIKACAMAQSPKSYFLNLIVEKK